MPRLTYRDRLETLISNPTMSARDKTFAQSLLSYNVRVQGSSYDGARSN